MLITEHCSITLFKYTAVVLRNINSLGMLDIPKLLSYLWILPSMWTLAGVPLLLISHHCSTASKFNNMYSAQRMPKGTPWTWCAVLAQPPFISIALTWLFTIFMLPLCRIIRSHGLSFTAMLMTLKCTSAPTPLLSSHPYNSTTSYRKLKLG